MIANKIANAITNVSKNSQQSHSEAVTNENDKKVKKKKIIINFLDNTPNQPSEFRTRNWVEIIYDVRAIYTINNQIRFKTSMLMSSLCDYS